MRCGCPWSVVGVGGGDGEAYSEDPKRNLFVGPMDVLNRQYTNGSATMAAWRKPRTMKAGMMSLREDSMADGVVTEV